MLRRTDAARFFYVLISHFFHSSAVWIWCVLPSLTDKPDHMLRLMLMISALAFITPGRKPSPADTAHSTPHASRAMHPLAVKAAEARSYAAKKRMNEKICFLLDLSIPSSQKRFFVVDLQKDSVLYRGMVTHGSCNQWLSQQRYSNEVGSGCTSLGKYRIGAGYVGQFGKAWKLHGLEAGNSNAFKRYVVLHSHDCVPDEPDGEELCQSQGCPTVSPAFLKKLEPLIKHTPKPILLWIYQ